MINFTITMKKKINISNNKQKKFWKNKKPLVLKSTNSTPDIGVCQKYLTL